MMGVNVHYYYLNHERYKPLFLPLQDKLLFFTILLHVGTEYIQGEVTRL